MNIEKVISTEKASIERYISEAQSQYDNQQYSAVNALPPDYRVLFVLVRNISVNNTLTGLPSSFCSGKKYFG